MHPTMTQPSYTEGHNKQRPFLYVLELILLNNRGQYNFHDPLNNDTPLLVAPSSFTGQ